MPAADQHQDATPSALQVFRRRMRAEGRKRIELCLDAADVEMMRELARKLRASDESSDELRNIIRSYVNRRRPTYSEWVEQLD